MSTKQLLHSSNSVEIKFPLYPTRFAPLAVEPPDLPPTP